MDRGEHEQQPGRQNPRSVEFLVDLAQLPVRVQRCVAATPNAVPRVAPPAKPYDPLLPRLRIAIDDLLLVAAPLHKPGDSLRRRQIFDLLTQLGPVLRMNDVDILREPREEMADPGLSGIERSSFTPRALDAA